MPKYIAIETTLVTAKLRLAKNCIGSIGDSVRSSWRTKAASRTMPAPMLNITSAEVQPIVWARTRPKTRPKRQVDRDLGAVALLEFAIGERGEDDADRDVEPEDPVPVADLDHRAADQRAD